MKRQLLEAILALTLEQEKALEQEDLEAFQSLLIEKQEKIEAIEALHQVNPHSKEERHEVLLQQIVVQDAANNKEFKRQFEEVKTNLAKTREKMNDLKRRQHGHQVYNNPYDVSDEEGIFYDRR